VNEGEIDSKKAQRDLCGAPTILVAVRRSSGAYDNIYIKDHIFDRMTGMMEELACEVEEHLDEIQEASQELYALGSITKQQRRKSKRGQVDHG